MRSAAKKCRAYESRCPRIACQSGARPKTWPQFSQTPAPRRWGTPQTSQKTASVPSIAGLPTILQRKRQGIGKLLQAPAPLRQPAVPRSQAPHSVNRTHREQRQLVLRHLLHDCWPRCEQPVGTRNDHVALPLRHRAIRPASHATLAERGDLECDVLIPANLGTRSDDLGTRSDTLGRLIGAKRRPAGVRWWRSLPCPLSRALSFCASTALSG